MTAPTGAVPGAHPDPDLLADLAGDALDPDDPVRSHVAGCARCRADLAAVSTRAAEVRALLAAEPRPGLPDDVAARLDAALAALPAARSDAAASAGADVTPLRRRQAGRGTLLAAAAGVSLLVVGVGVVLSDSGGGDELSSVAGGATTDSAAERSDPGPVVLATGTDYDASLLDARVPGLLGAGPLDGGGAGAGVAADAPAGPTPLGATTVSPTGESAVLGGEAELPEGPAALDRLSDPAALEGCLTELSGRAGTVPLLLDYASYDARPALVVALPGLSDDRVDVFVVGPGCAPGAANLLLYRSVAR